MSSKQLVRPGVAFWAIGGVSLLWNGATLANFFLQRNAEVLAGYSAAARAIVEGRPAWATGAFAVAALAGVAASLLILLRRALAVPAFIVALLAVVVTQAHTLRIVASSAPFRPINIALDGLLPIAVAGLFVAYSIFARRRGQIG